MLLVTLRLFQKQRYSNKTKQFFQYDIVVRKVSTCWDFPSKIREKVLKLEPDIGRWPRNCITNLLISYLSPEKK